MNDCKSKMSITGNHKFNNENHYVSKSVPNKIKQGSFYQSISRQLNHNPRFHKFRMTECIHIYFGELE